MKDLDCEKLADKEGWSMDAVEALAEFSTLKLDPPLLSTPKVLEEDKVAAQKNVDLTFNHKEESADRDDFRFDGRAKRRLLFSTGE